jgi:N-acetylneuraminic acid mutarotase
MSRRIPLVLTLILGAFALISCRDDTTPTEPRLEQESPVASEFSVAANSWTARADMPSIERWSLATAALTNAAGQWIVYAIGGKTATGGSLGKVMAYNVATNTWTYKASLPVPLFWTNGTGVVDGKIYISGGVSAVGKHHQDVLLMYNPATNTWTSKRTMPNPGYKGVTGVITGKLYVLTGCVDEEDCPLFDDSIFYRYDPATDLWTTLPPPPHSHMGGMGGVIGGKFYVTGGSAQLDVYDPTTNAWTTKAPMPQGRSGGAGVALDGKLFVVGGSTAGGSTRTTHAYNAITNTWVTRAPSPTAPGEIAASRVLLNGKPRIQMVGGKRPGNNLAYIP